MLLFAFYYVGIWIRFKQLDSFLDVYLFSSLVKTVDDFYLFKTNSLKFLASDISWKFLLNNFSASLTMRSILFLVRLSFSLVIVIFWVYASIHSRTLRITNHLETLILRMPWGAAAIPSRLNIPSMCFQFRILGSWHWVDYQQRRWKFIEIIVFMR